MTLHWLLGKARVFVSNVTVLLAFALAVGRTRLAHAERSPPEKAATEARQHYSDGARAFASKKYAEAAMHFEAACVAKPSPVALMSAGLAWDMAGRPALAADAYVRALEDPSLESKPRMTAKERLSELEKTLGTLVVDGPRDATVQLDGLTEAHPPARIHAVPGVRSVLVRRPGLSELRREVTLAAGVTTHFDLDAGIEEEMKPSAREPEDASFAPAPADDSAHAFEPTSSPRLAQSLGLGASAFGLATLGAAIVLGILASDAKAVFERAPTRESFEHASALEMSTNVALVTGAVFVVAGIVVMVASRQEGPPSVVSRRGVLGF